MNKTLSSHHANIMFLCITSIGPCRRPWSTNSSPFYTIINHVWSIYFRSVYIYILAYPLTVDTAEIIGHSPNVTTARNVIPLPDIIYLHVLQTSIKSLILMMSTVTSVSFSSVPDFDATSSSFHEMRTRLSSM